MSPRSRRWLLDVADVDTWPFHVARWRRCPECDGRAGTHSARCPAARAEFAGLGPLAVYLKALGVRRASAAQGHRKGCGCIVCSTGREIRMKRKIVETLIARNALACEEATGRRCRCRCGGALHGSAHSAEWQREQVEGLTVRTAADVPDVDRPGPG